MVPMMYDVLLLASACCEIIIILFLVFVFKTVQHAKGYYGLATIFGLDRNI
jgi:hypothetical protein